MNQKAVELLLDRMKVQDRSGPAHHAPDVRVVTFGLSYLSAFGYLERELEQWKDITLDDILKALGWFQRNCNLPETRNLDAATVAAMAAECRDGVDTVFTGKML